MNHDVFISFSSVNMDVAGKVVEALEESGGIRCWIASRDIVPSANYAEQLVEAIESCKLLLLILSGESNRSPQVAREIERAGSKGIPILPLRIEDIELSKSMEYFISSHHWLDAYPLEIEEYLPALIKAVKSSISGRTDQLPGTDAGTRRKGSQPKSPYISPQKILGACLVLVLLGLGFFLLRPEQTANGVNERNVSATHPATIVSQAATAPTSSQDALIQELIARYNKDKATPRKLESDDWTSSEPFAIAFLDITSSGIDETEQDFILNGIGEELRGRKRFSVIEREMIDKLLAELNLSSSDLADPATALKLGRILSANLIVTGSLLKKDTQWLASLRFIETETTAIKFSVSVLVEEGGTEKLISDMDKAIFSKLRKQFPLQAKIISVSGETAALNIGNHSGVSRGMVFTLLKENNLPAATGTVVSVEPEKSYLTLADNSAPVEQGMRLREHVEE